MTRPRVIAGLPLYRGNEHLPEALESLLLQDYPDLRIVVTDECVSSTGRDIVERYMQLDDRIEYVANEHRLGMIGNWRSAFTESRRRYPDAEFFFWASDHDVWHPRWLSSLTAALDDDPRAVAAIPSTMGIDARGLPLLRGVERDISMRADAPPSKRMRRAVYGMSAGNMIYGLFRASAVERVGVFPRVLLPDRLVLAKLALHGSFRVVPRVLWYRRYFENVQPSYARQRASFFPDKVPLYAYAPWWVQHSVAVLDGLVRRNQGAPAVGRARGAVLALSYSLASLTFHTRRRQHDAQRRLRRLKKRWRRRFVKPALRKAAHGKRQVLHIARRARHVVYRIRLRVHARPEI